MGAERNMAAGGNAVSVKDRAKEKLSEELKNAEEKGFAEPVIGYLLSRIEESEALAQDICQAHKTWKKCFDYIYGQARKHLNGKSGAIRDTVVYEWAEDYYHKEDKAEEEKKAEKVAPKNNTQEKKKAKEAEHKAPEPEKAVKEEKEPVKTKQKNSTDLEGQFDLFSFLDM